MRNTNHILRERNLRPNGICQCWREMRWDMAYELCSHKYTNQCTYTSDYTRVCISCTKGYNLLFSTPTHTYFLLYNEQLSTQRQITDNCRWRYTVHWCLKCLTQVKKARQRLYHLRQLRKFRVSPAILKTFYSGAIESVLTQCISVWYNNATNQDCKALQRVVRLAERISGSALPSLQDIYLKRCKSRAAKIIKDSNHPGNHLFCLLPSGKRFRSMMAKTERLRRSFFPQAIRLLNSVS